MSLVSRLDDELSNKMKEIYKSITKELEHPIFEGIRTKLLLKLSTAYLDWVLDTYGYKKIPSEVIHWSNKIDVSNITERRIQGEQTVWTAAGYTTKKGSDRMQMQGIIIKVCKEFGFTSEHFKSYCSWCDWKYTKEERQPSNQRRWEDYEVLKTADELGLLDT